MNTIYTKAWQILILYILIILPNHSWINCWANIELGLSFKQNFDLTELVVFWQLWVLQNDVNTKKHWDWLTENVENTVICIKNETMTLKSKL